MKYNNYKKNISSVRTEPKFHIIWGEAEKTFRYLKLRVLAFEAPLNTSRRWEK